MAIRELEPVADNRVWQIDNDINGNCRYVVHYLAVPFREQMPNETFRAHQLAHIEHSKSALYGKKYRASWFGGGIVFQAAEGYRRRIESAINAGLQAR